MKLGEGERAQAAAVHRFAIFGALASVLALVTSSCRGPTEIVLKVHTNAACTDSKEWRGIAVYVGEPGAALEKKWPTLVTTQCDAEGYVGSLIVAPSGDKADRVGLRVVAGLSRDPETCEEAGYAGCIVARRALRFSPHDSLELNVDLLTDCKSRACDPDHTCVSGRCVDDDFVDPSTVPADVPDEPSVRCGDDGLRCATTGDVCCLTVDESQGKTHGQCKPSKDCESIVLNCDDASDCAASGGADPSSVECFLQYDYDSGLAATDPNAPFEPTAVSISQCLPIASQVGQARLTLCQEKRPCKDMFSCRPSRGVGDRNRLPGYFWCEFF